MTPKNREELLEEIADGMADYDCDWQAQDSPGQWMYDRCAYYVLEKLEKAGLAIVPKEPTEAMVSTLGASSIEVESYRDMLDASPFRAKLDWYYAETDDEQKALEAAKQAPSEFFAEHGSRIEPQDRLTIECRAYHAAMTEGGIWISREDLADLSNDAYKWLSDKAEEEKVMADIAFEESVGSIAVDMPALEIRCFVDRLRAELEGNHDKND